MPLIGWATDQSSEPGGTGRKATSESSTDPAVPGGRPTLGSVQPRQGGPGSVHVDVKRMQVSKRFLYRGGLWLRRCGDALVAEGEAVRALAVEIVAFLDRNQHDTVILLLPRESDACARVL